MFGNTYFRLIYIALNANSLLNSLWNYLERIELRVFSLETRVIDTVQKNRI